MDPPQSRYLIKSVVRASKVLSAFQSPGEVLRLRDVAERTGFNRAMCFRFVYTLSKCGFLEKAGENLYRLISDKGPNRRFRIGYGSQEQDSSFQRAVLTGLTLAAQRESIELIVLDKRYNSKDALHKADQLVREQVDVVIEFQTDQAVAAAVTSKYVEKNIPIIAIDNPHPGATYFGANNYEAGLMAGQHLGRWARAHWEGVVDQVLLLDVSKVGWAVQARLRGTLEGLKQMLDSTRQLPVTTLDSDGQFGTVWETVRRHLRGLKGNRVLVGAANDSSALGALRAFEEAGRRTHCVVVSHDAAPEVRKELREPRTRLIGSVAFFPEKYGEGLIRLASDILAHKAVPPACFIRHILITPENVDHFYPNDQFLAGSY
jgi:ribose transport system substrate-binding protein